ncbi:MAG: hypothetical protein ACOX9C_04300 [Kiritimatiellia bacterium]|jgi:hypothetical protein
MRPDYANIGIALASIFFLLQVLSLILSIWQRLSRHPPIDQTLQHYVRRDEFEKFRDANDRVHSELFDLQRKSTDKVADEIKGLRESLSQWQLSTAKLLGNIEGRTRALELKKESKETK